MNIRNRISFRPLVAGLLIFLPIGFVLADGVTKRRSPSTEELQRLRPRTADIIPKDYLPTKEANLVKATLLGKEFWFYDRIEWNLQTDQKLPVRFHLIVAESTGPFYLMENKVWNGLFREFDMAKPSSGPDREADRQWTVSATEYQMNAKLASDAKLPVFEVRYERARQFANWLNGDLPTRVQWDAAAGWAAGKTGGPFLQPADGESLQVCVGRSPAVPWQVDECQHDVSPVSGCRQMAGNGKEWTRRESSEQNVKLRGRFFGDKKPLTYAEFTSETTFGSQPVSDLSPFVSFRVALEIK